MAKYNEQQIKSVVRPNYLWDRNHDIYTKRVEGMSFSRIAERHGCSRQHAQQTYKRHKIKVKTLEEVINNDRS